MYIFKNVHACSYFFLFTGLNFYHCSWLNFFLCVCLGYTHYVQIFLLALGSKYNLGGILGYMWDSRDQIWIVYKQRNLSTLLSFWPLSSFLSTLRSPIFFLKEIYWTKEIAQVLSQFLFPTDPVLISGHHIKIPSPYHNAS